VNAVILALALLTPSQAPAPPPTHFIHVEARMGGPGGFGADVGRSPRPQVGMIASSWPRQLYVGTNLVAAWPGSGFTGDVWAGRYGTATLDMTLIARDWSGRTYPVRFKAAPGTTHVQVILAP
jgi:hypothetical protein